VFDLGWTFAKVKGGRKERKGSKDLFRIDVVSNRSLNTTEGGREEGRKGRVKIIQGRYG